MAYKHNSCFVQADESRFFWAGLCQLLPPCNNTKWCWLSEVFILSAVHTAGAAACCTAYTHNRGVTTVCLVCTAKNFFRQLVFGSNQRIGVARFRGWIKKSKFRIIMNYGMRGGNHNNRCNTTAMSNCSLRRAWCGRAFSASRIMQNCFFSAAKTSKSRAIAKSESMRMRFWEMQKEIQTGTRQRNARGVTRPLLNSHFSCCRFRRISATAKCTRASRLRPNQNTSGWLTSYLRRMTQTKMASSHSANSAARRKTSCNLCTGSQPIVCQGLVQWGGGQ